MNIVGCAVKWVDQPAISFVGQAAAAFFGNKAGFGKQGGELGDQPFLRLLVYIRYVIVGTLFFYPAAVEFASFFFQESSGFTGYSLYLGTQFL